MGFMIEFDEGILLWALTSRPADVQQFSEIFRPEWLSKAVYQPMVAEIYNFAKETGIPPSLKTLEEIFKDKYPDSYENKFKSEFEQIRSLNPDISEVIYTVNKARDVAIVRSLNELVNSQELIRAAEDFDGKVLLRRVNDWLNNFVSVSDEQSSSLREAIESLLRSSVMTAQSPKLPCGIQLIDDWTNGGMRTKELGIILAPTGHGKSAVLMNMAYKITAMQELPVWFITNELSLDEQTERFLSRMTQSPLSHVQIDPADAYKGMGRHWRVAENIRITSVNRTVTTKEMEAMMIRWANISGWKPKVIIVDFMERMAPNDRGYARDKEWQWIGAIATDLVRFAKRHNILIWTAAQTNRAGLSKNVELELGMTQGSIRQLQEATTVIAMHQIDMNYSDDEGEKKIGLELAPLKLRSGKKRSKKILDLKLDTMLITNKIIEMQDEEVPDVDRK